MDPPTEDKIEVSHPKLKTAAGVAIGVAVWIITCVLPVTFMVAMAWSCESHTRQLGRRILLFYDGGADSAREAIKAAEHRHDKGMTAGRSSAALRSSSRSRSRSSSSPWSTIHRQSTGIDWLGRSRRARRAVAHRCHHRRHRPPVIGRESSGRDDARGGRGP